jgi:hypothetical protein
MHMRRSREHRAETASDKSFVDRSKQWAQNNRVLAPLIMAGGVIIFLGTVASMIIVLVGVVRRAVHVAAKPTTNFTHQYQLLLSLNLGSPLDTLKAQLGPAAFEKPWASPPYIEEPGGERFRAAPLHGLQDEWVIRAGGRAVALVVALSDVQPGRLPREQATTSVHPTQP